MVPLHQLVVCCMTALIAHWGYFVRGEHDLRAGRIAGFYLLTAAAIAFANTKLQCMVILDAVFHAFVVVIVHLVFVLCSVAFYRLFLSPIRRFPGPLRLRLSKLSHIYDAALSPNFRTVHRLHQEYGDAVRTGPNEMTLFGADAYTKIHGPDSLCTKGVYYDLIHPTVSLETTRDPVVHQKLRKVWDQALSVRSLQRLEALVYHEAERLVQQLLRRQGTPLDITKWFEYYTWDLMGRFGLNVDFGSLSQGWSHPIQTLFPTVHAKEEILGAAPWVRHLLNSILSVYQSREAKFFGDWCKTELERTIKDNAKDRGDVISYVIEHARVNGGIEANWNHIVGDFIILLAAGSDPGYQVLSNLMFYLLREPAQLDQIRLELASIDVQQYSALQTASHLNACIYETLRMHPAVASAGMRVTPPGGLVVGNTVIPEGINVFVPQYSLFRDPRHFVDPETWVPERFSTRPDLILDERAFMPWSTGKYSCIGKNLSLMEIRVAAALVISNLDFEFAPGEDGARMFAETVECFTTRPGRMDVVVTPRA